MHCQTDRQHGCFLWGHCLRIAYSDNVQGCNKDDFGNLNLQAVDPWLHSVSLQLSFPCSGTGRSGCQSTRYLAAFISWLHSVSLQPFFLCLGIGGSGRQSTTRLAAFISDFQLFQIEITKNYTTTEWRDDLRRMMRRAGDEGVSTVFLFGDHQIKVCSGKRG